MSKRLWSIILFVLIFPVAALGQSTTDIADGKAFAESMAPTAKGQIVNPVTAKPAWTTGGQSASMPSGTPADLGPFSAPVPTTSTMFSTTKAFGALAGVGNAKINTCLNQAPTGDAMLDQECIAVRFMNKNCVSMTAAQTQVLGGAGQSSPVPLGCTDSYGSGNSQFDYKNLITETDTVFTAVRSAQENASLTVAPNCVNTPVVTNPAEYAVNTCCKTAATDLKTCTKELQAKVDTVNTPADVAYTCVGGVLVGKYCNSSSDTAALISSYSCPPGWNLSGIQCTQTTTTAATGSYVCPPGAVLNGTSCLTTTTTAAGTAYSCPNGGVLQGTSCITTTTSTPTSIYSCPSGSLVNGTQCQVNTTTAASSSYSCTAGWTLDGATCKKYTYTGASIQYSCEASAVLVGTSCVTSSTVPANATLSCTAGTLVNGQCNSTTIAAAFKSFYCEPGFAMLTVNGEVTGCQRIVTAVVVGTDCGSPQPAFYMGPTLDQNGICKGLANYLYEGWECIVISSGGAAPPAKYNCQRPAIPVYACPDGGVLNSGTCVTNNSASFNYSCTSGTLQGDQCVTVVSGPAQVNYTCSSGTLSGTSCVITTNGPAIQNYFCPSGGTLNGATCEGVTVNPADIVFSCPNGGTLNGQQCDSTTISSAIVNYSCPPGQSLSGMECTGTTVAPATSYYICPNGMTLSGQSCTSVAISPAILNYSCPIGTTLFGLECKGTSVTPATPNYSCLPGQVLNGQTCTLVTTLPATPNYSCPGGIPPTGDLCVTYTTSINWINNCIIYEQSAGTSPGNPP